MSLYHIYLSPSSSSTIVDASEPIGRKHVYMVQPIRERQVAFFFLITTSSTTAYITYRLFRQFSPSLHDPLGSIGYLYLFSGYLYLFLVGSIWSHRLLLNPVRSRHVETSWEALAAALGLRESPIHVIISYISIYFLFFNNRRCKRTYWSSHPSLRMFLECVYARMAGCKLP